MDPVSIVSVLTGLGDSLIKRLWPDPADQAKAQLELFKMQQEGQFKEVELQLSAIVSESQSPDPWTSRARPSFLYVIYVMILMSIPVAFLSVFKPDIAAQLAFGMQAWLAAIPESMWTLFGVGYLGYSGARSWEKTKGVSK